MASEQCSSTFCWSVLQLQGVVDRLTKQLEEKGKSINEYREKHNIKVRGEEEQGPSEHAEGKSSSSGVLVEKDAT